MMATRTTTTRTIRTVCAPSANARVPFTAPVLEHAPDFQEVMEAYLDCRKNKRNTPGSLMLEMALTVNLVQLQKELANGTYRIGNSTCFAIKNPKPREVWAANFRDRIVHHVVYNRIKNKLHNSFSPASCACIPERGTLYGVKRLERFIRSASQNWTQPAYYLKVDVSNFFSSIYKPALHGLLVDRFDPWADKMIEKIIYHDPTKNYVLSGDAKNLELIPPHKSLFNAPLHTGLPIGNLSSQLFANVYMDAVDKYIDHIIKPLGYVRYADDMILVDTCKKKLARAQHQINAVLKDRLRIELNPRKTILQPVNRGVDFVGFVIKPWHTVPRRAIMPKALQAIEAEHCPDKRLHTANSYLGLLRQSKSRAQRARIANRLRSMGHTVDWNYTKVVKTGENHAKHEVYKVRERRLPRPHTRNRTPYAPRARRPRPRYQLIMA